METLALVLKLFFFFVSAFLALFYGTISLHNMFRANTLKPKTLFFACLGITGIITILTMGYFH